MSRKKILIPLAKRHTHHRTLALVQRSESVTSEGVDKAFWVDAVVLVLGRARKRFKPSSRRWICPIHPDLLSTRTVITVVPGKWACVQGVAGNGHPYRDGLRPVRPPASKSPAPRSGATCARYGVGPDWRRQDLLVCWPQPLARRHYSSDWPESSMGLAALQPPVRSTMWCAADPAKPSALRLRPPGR